MKELRLVERYKKGENKNKERRNNKFYIFIYITRHIIIPELIVIIYNSLNHVYVNHCI